MPGEHIEVDDAAFKASIPVAIEGYKEYARDFIRVTADKVVEIAEGLAPFRTGRLREDIKAGVFYESEQGGFVPISVNVREGFYQEFGTSKMRAHPYLRPALAQAAGALRSFGFAARTSSSSSARANIKRAALRQKVRRAYKRGTISAQDRISLAHAIANIRTFRSTARRARRRSPRRTTP